jgi:L-rhamnonate dehydratase
VISQHSSPFAEFLMMAPEADRVMPMFTISPSRRGKDGS